MTIQKVLFNNCQFTKNQIGNNALFWTESNGNSLVWIENSIISQINSKDRGSVVYAYSKQSNVEFINTEIKENSALYGGIFYSSYESWVYFENSTLSNNFAVYGAIGFASSNGYVVFNSTNIVNNQAGDIFLEFQESTNDN